MQHIDGICQFGEIDHTERVRSIPNANLLDARPDCRYELPIIGSLAVLHFVNLIPGFTSCCFGKGTKIIKRSTDKFNGLHEPYYT